MSSDGICVWGSNRQPRFCNETVFSGWRLFWCKSEWKVVILLYFSPPISQISHLTDFHLLPDITHIFHPSLLWHPFPVPSTPHRQHIFSWTWSHPPSSHPLSIISFVPLLTSFLFLNNREMCLSSKLKHRNLLTTLYATRKPPAFFGELCPHGNLGQLIHNYRNLYSMQFVWSCACDILSALAYLHHHRIVHLDLKPQNLLINKNFDLVNILFCGGEKGRRQERRGKMRRWKMGMRWWIREDRKREKGGGEKLRRQDAEQKKTFLMWWSRFSATSVRRLSLTGSTGQDLSWEHLPMRHRRF